MGIINKLAWVAALGGSAVLVSMLWPTYAKADEPYEEGFHQSYKDAVPSYEDRKWRHQKPSAYYYNEQRYVQPKRERTYVGEEGQPLYRNDKIEEMCLKLANKGLQGTVTFYDLKYRRNVCDFNQGYYNLNRYKYEQ